jgi:hypothetical protein
MSVRIYKPNYIIPELGESGRIPDGGITNIGGTIHPTFTVGGRGLLFADGTTTDGTPAPGLNLQTSYDASSSPAVINLATGKNIVFNSVGLSNSITIDADTGDMMMTANLTVGGLVNGIDLVTFFNSFTNHLGPASLPYRHRADQISADDSSFINISGGNVQAALESIDSQLSTIMAGDVEGFEFQQFTPVLTWVIPHNKNSRRVQITVWDETDEVLLPHRIIVTNLNTVTIEFQTPQAGRAVLMIY